MAALADLEFGQESEQRRRLPDTADEMGKVNSSPHGTWWRLVLTESAGAESLPEARNRLLHKWSPTPQRWPGWRHAVTVRVPHSSLRPGWPEPTAKPRPVEFVLPPRPGHELRLTCCSVPGWR